MASPTTRAGRVGISGDQLEQYRAQLYREEDLLHGDERKLWTTKHPHRQALARSLGERRRRIEAIRESIEELESLL